MISDVKNWLKSLRLHKYWHLLCQLSYEQILSLTEENFDSVLETIGGGQVTQGARRKIILSIVKLRERATLLDSLEQARTFLYGAGFLFYLLNNL